MGDEAAAECLNQGAADYFLTDRMARLGPAVNHALEQRQFRADQRRAEREVTRLYQELRDRVGDLETLLDMLPLGVWIGDATAARIIGNGAAYEMMDLPIGSNMSLTSPEREQDPLRDTDAFRIGPSSRPTSYRCKRSCELDAA